jgi:hypothetical protein
MRRYLPATTCQLTNLGCLFAAVTAYHMGARNMRAMRKQYQASMASMATPAMGVARVAR